MTGARSRSAERTPFGADVRDAPSADAEAAVTDTFIVCGKAGAGTGAIGCAGWLGPLTGADPAIGTTPQKGATEALTESTPLIESPVPTAIATACDLAPATASARALPWAAARFEPSLLMPACPTPVTTIV
jgi:hypothetical protein